MARAYIGLGSNMGNKADFLREAVEAVNQLTQTTVMGKSSFYTTSPVGYLEQEDFINVVIEIETGLSPYDLLQGCQNIENNLKRVRVIHWGPRTIDLDILWYESFVGTDEKLIVPHPRMTERGFVLVPLSELNDQLVISGKTVHTWLQTVETQDIRKMTHEKW